MKVDSAYVRHHFAALAEQQWEEFWGKVSPTVDWTVMGSHALSGHYTSRDAFQKATLQRLNPRMQGGLGLTVTQVIVDADNRACVELSTEAKQKSGKPFDNKYAWIVRYNDEGVIDEVRAYLDGHLVNEAINENAGP